MILANALPLSFVFRVATTFFAMTVYGLQSTVAGIRCIRLAAGKLPLSPPPTYLLDLFVQRNFLQERIVLLPFDPGRRIFPVLRRDVPGHAGNTAVFLLGALQNNLDSIGAFLCHCLVRFLDKERKGTKINSFGKRHF